MKKSEIDFGSKIRELRISKKITQNELDKLANLPATSTAKIEQGRRQVEANELMQIANALSVSVHWFFPDQQIHIAPEEIDVLEALRIVAFDKYKRIITSLEADIYFRAKEVRPEKKKKFSELVVKLSRLGLSDHRPRAN